MEMTKKKSKKSTR